jgi:3,4-dihydroxy 2-butanone 4-phosphate synthase/GTP cyclohydrolase II
MSRLQVATNRWEPEQKQGLFSGVDEVVAAVRCGDPVVLMDDEGREHEDNLVMAGQFATQERISFFVRHTAGLICAPMLGSRLDELRIPLMVDENFERQRTAFTVSVDARDGTTTGISAADRARTIQVLSDGCSHPADLRRPGHVFPLRYRDGGVLRRARPTEASIDLLRLARLEPTAVVSQIVADGATGMPRAADLRRLAADHRLPLLPIAALVAYRLRREALVERVAEARIPKAHGTFTGSVYRSVLDGQEHFVLTMGPIERKPEVPVAVHHECLVGDVFRTTGCRCRWRLDTSLRTIADEGLGVVVYLRLPRPEKSGGGEALPAAGLHVGAAHERRADEFETAVAAQILLDLGVAVIRHLPSTAVVPEALEPYGLEQAPGTRPAAREAG